MVGRLFCHFEGTGLYVLNLRGDFRVNAPEPEEAKGAHSTPTLDILADDFIAAVPVCGYKLHQFAVEGEEALT